MNPMRDGEILVLYFSYDKRLLFVFEIWMIGGASRDPAKLKMGGRSARGPILQPSHIRCACTTSFNNQPSRFTPAFAIGMARPYIMSLSALVVPGTRSSTLTIGIISANTSASLSLKQTSTRPHFVHLRNLTHHYPYTRCLP